MKQLRRKTPELLEHVGLHQEKIFRETLVPGLRAKKTEFFAQNGIVVETREVVDHEQREKYFDRYCKLLGLYGNECDGNSDSLRRSPVTVNLVIANQGVAEAITRRLAGGQSGDEQPALDVSLDEYERRPRSGESPYIPHSSAGNAWKGR
jgi:hypothetical protein